MDWSQCADVESRPDVVSGAWVVRGTRVQADAIIDNAADGLSADQIATEIFTSVPVERVRGVIEYARALRF